MCTNTSWQLPKSLADAIMSAGFQSFAFRHYKKWTYHGCKWINEVIAGRSAIYTPGHGTTVYAWEELSGRRGGPHPIHHQRNHLFNALSLSLLHRSLMEEPSSRKFSPTTQCLIPITLTWRTTAGVKTWCTNQQSGEPQNQSINLKQDSLLVQHCWYGVTYFFPLHLCCSTSESHSFRLVHQDELPLSAT